MKFDTRDKKPKLWNVAILSVALAVITAILQAMGTERNALTISILFVVYFVAVLILLLNAFRKQIQYNPYSYNTIYYVGFSLFVLSLIITHLILIYNKIHYPEQYGGSEIYHLLLNSAKTYMIYSAPFILLFSVGLCISNISLIRHEGKRIVNVLGIILSVLLVGGILFLYAADFYATGSMIQVMLHDLFLNLFAAIYLYFECMLIGAIVADLIAARYEPEKDKDFLIILGCGIRKDGTPMPLLRGRIDRALAFAKKQKETTGKDLIFVTSGGQGRDEVISESACMKRYLLEQGVPKERILEEDRSTSTFENMKYSKAKIEAIKPSGKVAFSTTNYHVFRSGLYARRVKMRAVGMGADTKWYFWPNASVREFVGILTEHRLKQGIIFGCLIVAYVVMTLVAYLA